MPSLVMEPINLDTVLEREVKHETAESIKKNELDDERETLSPKETHYHIKEDYCRNSLTAVDDSVYNECTIPLNEPERLFHVSMKKNLTKSSSTTPLAVDGVEEHTIVDLNGNYAHLHKPEADLDNDEAKCNEFDSAQVKFTPNKTSTHADMIQSINNLRLNVNSHIIGGSKNIMGRMRKLSMNELNRHGRPTTRRNYKAAFYITLSALSLLFLYLIYQNLFNDRLIYTTTFRYA